jgi:hypothetical protein
VQVQVQAQAQAQVQVQVRVRVRVRVRDRHCHRMPRGLPSTEGRRTHWATGEWLEVSSCRGIDCMRGKKGGLRPVEVCFIPITTQF